jgi:hypothetical protein
VYQLPHIAAALRAPAGARKLRTVRRSAQRHGPDRTGSGGVSVELAHQPPVGLAGCGEFLVTFLQYSPEVQDCLAFGLEVGVEGGGAGRGAEAATVEGVLPEEFR